MSKFAVRVIVPVLAFGLALAFAAPAFAVVVGTVPNHAIVGSVDLYGMDEVSARAAISQEASVTNLPVIQATSAGVTLNVTPRNYLTLDVEGMLAKAYAPSAETTFTIARMANIATPTVDAFVGRMATKVYRARHDAYYYVAHSRMHWKPAVYGRALYKTSSKTLLMNALRSQSTTVAPQPTVKMPYHYIAPKITNSKLGRAILVDKSQRKLRLYDHSNLIRRYGVAIGMARYPTPTGTFKIIAKVKNPAWYNPGSDWASGMPNYIAPGPSNPLGTRALYLNSPGIRIHGTNKTWTIGTAASHGCIRVANHNIEKLYPSVPVGTKVFIIK